MNSPDKKSPDSLIHTEVEFELFGGGHPACQGDPTLEGVGYQKNDLQVAK